MQQTQIHKICANKKIFLVIAILILFAAGCTGGTGRKSSDVDFHVRFSGLSIEFMKNSPPAKVFEGDIIPVLIKVKNSGAYSTKDSQAIVSLGVEKDYTKNVNLLQGGRIQQFRGLSNAASFSLEGRSITNPNGDEEIISYNVETGKVDPQSEAHSSAVIATLC